MTSLDVARRIARVTAYSSDDWLGFVWAAKEWGLSVEATVELATAAGAPYVAKAALRLGPAAVPPGRSEPGEGGGKPS